MIPDEIILFEDNHLIIVNKPAGMLVQGDETGDKTLADEIKEYLKKRYNKPGNVFLGISHRIDRPVSGTVIFTKTGKALARINE
ncbi:MAG: pseudouridine synthase, partial [Bacteroidales bacterium]|nr:pseudouridine synthase [Bacteroidales bacterium]